MLDRLAYTFAAIGVLAMASRPREPPFRRLMSVPAAAPFEDIAIFYDAKPWPDLVDHDRVLLGVRVAAAWSLHEVGSAGPLCTLGSVAWVETTIDSVELFGSRLNVRATEHTTSGGNRWDAHFGWACTASLSCERFP